jgi:hypothetical protein
VAVGGFDEADAAAGVGRPTHVERQARKRIGEFVQSLPVDRITNSSLYNCAEYFRGPLRSCSEPEIAAELAEQDAELADAAQREI